MNAVQTLDISIPEKGFVRSKSYRYHGNLDTIRRFSRGVPFVRAIKTKVPLAKLPQPCGDPVRNYELLRACVDGAVSKVPIPVPVQIIVFFSFFFFF